MGLYSILIYALFCFLNTPWHQQWSCVDLRWLNVWNGCRVGPGQTACTFIAIDVWCVIDFTWSCYCNIGPYVIPPHVLFCFVFLSKYTLIILWRVLRWSLLVECMERLSCWPWTNSAYVFSYYCAVCDSYSKPLFVFSVVWSVCNFISCAILLSEYTATSLIIMALHWSLLVECMERVLCWPLMHSTYVCSYCCAVCDWPYSKLLLVFDAVCMGPYLILPHAPFCSPNTPQRSQRDLHWSSLVECVEWVPCWPWTNSAYV